jgi:hypothetical protein
MKLCIAPGACSFVSHVVVHGDHGDRERHKQLTLGQAAGIGCQPFVSVWARCVHDCIETVYPEHGHA